MRRGFSRTTFSRLLALAGVIIILGQAMFIAETQLQIAVILIGILISQTGTWGLASRLLPDRRSYLRLRAEVERFLDLVRKVHGQAIDRASDEVEATRAEMHESVDRIVSVAGAEAGA